MKTSLRISAVNTTTKTFFLVAFVLGLAVCAHAATKVIPKDALVLEKGVVIRQFGDNQGKIIAKPNICDELLLLEPVRFKGAYEEVLFLTADAQKVRRGWIKPSKQLYVFPEARPILPRSDTTPEVAFPWNSKAPQPGDPDYARVTSKDFLLMCLAHPHPARAAAVLTQLFDRYMGDLTKGDVEKLLPILRFARDDDRPRIRDLLQKFKDDPAVKDFLGANPIFGAQIVEPEIKPTVKATPPPEEKSGKIIKIAVYAALGIAVLLLFVVLVSKLRKKKDVDSTLTSHGEGPEL